VCVVRLCIVHCVLCIAFVLSVCVFVCCLQRTASRSLSLLPLSVGVCVCVCVPGFLQCTHTGFSPHLACVLPVVSLVFVLFVEYVIYHELVRTSRTYMRGVTAIHPKWLHSVAPSLCTFSKPFAVPPPRCVPRLWRALLERSSETESEIESEME
jgi:Oligonucleotide/oligosaccharide-binding (OB)-fold